MGVRTNAILTALNYYLNDKIEQEKQQREDKRKLDNYEKMEVLKNDLENRFNPYAQEARNLADQINIRNGNIEMGRTDDLKDIAKLKDAKTKRDLLTEEELAPIEKALKQQEYNFKMQYNPRSYQYQNRKMDSDMNDLEYAIANKDKNRNLEEALKNYQLQLAKSKLTGQNLHNARLREAGNSAGGKGVSGAYLSSQNPYKLLELRKDIASKIAELQAKAKEGMYEASDIKAIEDLTETMNMLDNYIYGNSQQDTTETLYSKLKETFSGFGNKIGNIEKLVYGQMIPNTNPKAQVQTNPAASKEAAIAKQLSLAAETPEEPQYGNWGAPGKFAEDTANSLSNWYNDMNIIQQLMKLDYANKKTKGYYNKNGFWGLPGRKAEQLKDWYLSTAGVTF